MTLILENLQPALYGLIIGILIGAVVMLCWVSWRMDKADWQEMNRDLLNQLKGHLKKP